MGRQAVHMLRDSLQRRLNQNIRLGNPYESKPEKNKLLKFHGSQNYFLFVYGWGELVYFKQILPALRHLAFTFLPFKHSEGLVLLYLNY